jgi:FKBP-type peptidyl-prolyl cis-trans isomerase FkpA
MQKMLLVFLIFASLGLVMYSGCSKKNGASLSPCTNEDPFADSAALLFFADTSLISPLTDTIGLYYQIVNQGTGARPNVNSAVFVTYTGTFLNGVIFDSTTNAAQTGFPLGGLIPGWQIGLPAIQVGGRIKLLIPSAYGYGCQGYVNRIPANAPLYFDITLDSIK